MKRSSVLFVLACVSVAHPAAALEVESWDAACGAVCLRVASRLLGRDIPLAEFRRRIPSADKGVASMADLAAIAKDLGLETAGVQLSLDAIETCTVPLIVFRPPHHFIVLVGLGQGKGVLWIDAPHQPRIMTDADKASIEPCRALAVSETLLRLDHLSTAAAGDTTPIRHNPAQMFGGLRVPDPLWNLGRIRPRQVLHHQFVLHNPSPEPLTLSDPRVSCPCLSSKTTSLILPPGASGVWDVSLDSTGLGGSIEKSLILKVASLSQSTTAVLRASGQVSTDGELTVSPARLLVGPLTVGQPCDGEITLRRLGSQPVLLRDASCDQPWASAGSPADAGGPEANHVSIRVHVQPPPTLGPFRAVVTFQTDHALVPTAVATIEGTVVPELEAHPSAVYIGSVSPGAEVSRTIQVTNRGATEIVLQRATVKNAPFSATIERSRDSTGAWSVRLRGVVPDANLVIHGTLVLESSSDAAPRLEIPIDGIVWK